jgi:DegV family protein with EDD domain
MKIQVITDSTSDIPPETAKKLGIRVVPIYVRFGDKVYRDGVDLDNDSFYQTLEASPMHPATSQPNPEDFEKVYREYIDTCDGIISIHISSKISGTCNAAVIAKNKLNSPFPIEVIDSGFNSAGLALVTMSAARLAKTAKEMPSLLAEIRGSIQRTHMFGYFNTMKYLAWSGRINRVIVAAAGLLNVKPLLTFRDGEIMRAGLVRSFNQGADRLFQFVEERKNIEELLLVHSAIPGKALEFKKRLAKLFPEEKINIFRMGAGLGVHGGPGVLLAALCEAGKE